MLRYPTGAKKGILPPATWFSETVGSSWLRGYQPSPILVSSPLCSYLPSLPPSWGLQGLISNDLDPQRQSLGLPGYGGQNEIAHRIIMSDPLGFLSLIRSQRASICGGFSPSKRDCHVSRDRGTQESWLMISHQQCERLFPRSISRIFV